MSGSDFLIAIAVAFGLFAGYFSAQGIMAWARRRRPAELLRKEMEVRSWLADAMREGPAELILAYAERTTRRFSFGRFASSFSGRNAESPEEKRLLRAAGLELRVSSEGMRRVRIELALGFSTCGALLGACLSSVMLVIFAVGGFCAGWKLPSWALEKRVKERAEQADRHLPEMLDVVSLGLRSGLSFDAALGAYCEHFHTLLSHELGLAKEQWERSLVTRDEALVNVAALFDSPALKRVLGDVSRSLRFGSSLAGSLDAVALQVRKEYRARKEEEVAKAPVKMMVPTGVLILPAMLILVLGPVMLELMVGL